MNFLGYPKRGPFGSQINLKFTLCQISWSILDAEKKQKFEGYELTNEKLLNVGYTKFDNDMKTHIGQQYLVKSCTCVMMSVY